ncbi:glycosyltransferase [Halorubrum trueperi]|uniref:Glycosyltransferase n=1 Tax=Halorubrum trueperi TaxID=2004704 RepID=A0ABD5UG18_9EURY
MRLLILADWGFPCDEPFMREVYTKRWQERGHEVVWGFRSSTSEIQCETWCGAPAYLMPSRTHDEVRTVVDGVTRQNHAIKTLWETEGPFDAIQVRNDLAFGLRAMRLAQSQSVPFVYRLSHLKSEELCLGYRDGVDGYGLTDFLRGQIGKRVRRTILDGADLTLTISDAMTDHLRSQGFCGPIESLPMGADTSLQPTEIDPKPFQDRFDVGSNYLVYIGTMNPIRQLEFLFPVLAQVREQRPDTTLVMVGGRNDEHRNRLKHAAEHYGVADSVCFTGWVEETTLRRAIVGAEIGLSVFPPNYVLRTNSPTKALEYMNHSTPVIGTQTPEQIKILSESGAGRTVEFETGTFSETILNLLTDVDTRKQMGRRGREYIENRRNYDLLCERAVTLYEAHT